MTKADAYLLAVRWGYWPAWHLFDLSNAVDPPLFTRGTEYAIRETASVLAGMAAVLLLVALTLFYLFIIVCLLAAVGGVIL